MAAGNPRRQSRAVHDVGHGKTGQRSCAFPYVGMEFDFGSPYASFMDHQVDRTMIAVDGAFITDTLRSCSAGVSGTAEIAVLDSELTALV